MNTNELVKHINKTLDKLKKGEKVDRKELVEFVVSTVNYSDAVQLVGICIRARSNEFEVRTGPKGGTWKR